MGVVVFVVRSVGEIAFFEMVSGDGESWGDWGGVLYPRDRLGLRVSTPRGRRGFKPGLARSSIAQSRPVTRAGAKAQCDTCIVTRRPPRTARWK